MIQVTLEENQARCDFFKHFQYNTKDKLGTVSVINRQASNQPTIICVTIASQSEASISVILQIC